MCTLSNIVSKSALITSIELGIYVSSQWFGQYICLLFSVLDLLFQRKLLPTSYNYMYMRCTYSYIYYYSRKILMQKETR